MVKKTDSIEESIKALPKVIVYDNTLYSLDMHITAWNKICIGYQYVCSPKDAFFEKKEYNIFSQVVKEGMDPSKIKDANFILDIIDVPDVRSGFNILCGRIMKALANQEITIK